VCIYTHTQISHTQNLLSKISAICDFGQPIQIANIFLCGMADQNHE
jgi:hypothetical protein